MTDPLIYASSLYFGLGGALAGFFHSETESEGPVVDAAFSVIFTALWPLLLAGVAVIELIIGVSR